MLDVDRRHIKTQLRAFVRGWFDLIAEGDAAHACALLDEPNSYGVRWTPASIFAAVQDTFASGTLFYKEHPGGPIFTRSAETVGRSHWSYGAFADRSGYWLVHDVPLNGEWSDLSAEFELKWRADRLAVILHDLHVM